MFSFCKLLLLVSAAVGKSVAVEDGVECEFCSEEYDDADDESEDEGDEKKDSEDGLGDKLELFEVVASDDL